MATAKINDKFYCAGTNKGPVFARNCSNEVWLFTDTVFFVEYGGKCLMKAPSSTIRKVCLWEVDVGEYKKAKKHSEFEGIFVCPCPPKVTKCMLMKELSSLPWKKSEELPSGEVTSLLDGKVLRKLVRVYLNNNPPKTAEDFNSQAELKAVSHWRWLKDREKAEFVPGPHHDPRLKTAADFVLKTWKDELLKHEKMDADDNSSSDDIISDLKGGIFFLKMYYMSSEDKKNGTDSKCHGFVPQEEGLSHLTRKRQRLYDSVVDNGFF